MLLASYIPAVSLGQNPEAPRADVNGARNRGRKIRLYRFAMRELRKHTVALFQASLHARPQRPGEPQDAGGEWPRFRPTRCGSRGSSPDGPAAPDTPGFHPHARALDPPSDTASARLACRRGPAQMTTLSVPPAPDTRAPPALLPHTIPPPLPAAPAPFPRPERTVACWPPPARSVGFAPPPSSSHTASNSHPPSLPSARTDCAARFPVAAPEIPPPASSPAPLRCCTPAAPSCISPSPAHPLQTPATSPVQNATS